MDQIKQIIFTISFIALCITAQYTPPIPCINEESCVRVLGMDQDPKCVGSVCLCRNSTTKYRLCSSKDLAANGRQGSLGRGLGRGCETSADCQRIEGAECREQPGDRSRHCLCRPGAVPSPDGQRCLPAGPGGSPNNGPRYGPQNGPQNGPRYGSQDGSRYGPQDGPRNGPQDGSRNGPLDNQRNGPFEGPRNAHHEDRPGERCTQDSECAMRAAGMECGPEGICRCHDGFHETSSTRQCVPNKGYGERCTREEESCYQPTGPHNENALKCSNNFSCTCSNNYVFKDGLCQSSDGSRTTISILLFLMAFFTVKLF